MSSNHETEAKKFEFQTIKNRFSTYEERCAKRSANLDELLRSQVEPGYTPNYVSGSYIKPGVSIEHNTELDDSDGYWRMWFFDLSEASGTVDVKVTVTFSSTLQETHHKTQNTDPLFRYTKQPTDIQHDVTFHSRCHVTF